MMGSIDSIVTPSITVFSYLAITHFSLSLRTRLVIIQEKYGVAILSHVPTCGLCLETYEIACLLNSSPEMENAQSLNFLNELIHGFIFKTSETIGNANNLLAELKVLHFLALSVL